MSYIFYIKSNVLKRQYKKIRKRTKRCITCACVCIFQDFDTIACRNYKKQKHLNTQQILKQNKRYGTKIN